MLEDMTDLEAALRRAVGGEVGFDVTSRALTTMDASNYRRVPLGVVAPRDADDVAAVLEVCRAHGTPVVARGGGTSIAGQATGTGVVLDFTRHMNRLIDLDPGDSHRRRPARPGPRPPPGGRRPARPALRPRPLHPQPLHPRRHDRQQLVRLPLGGVGHDGGQRARTVGAHRAGAVPAARTGLGRGASGPARAGVRRGGTAAHGLSRPAPPHLRLRAGRAAAGAGRGRGPLLLRFGGHAGRADGGGGAAGRVPAGAGAGGAGIRGRGRGGGGGGRAAAARAADRGGHGGGPGALHAGAAPRRGVAVRRDGRRLAGAGAGARGGGGAGGRRRGRAGGDRPGRSAEAVACPGGRERHGDPDGGRVGGLARLGGLRGAPGPAGRLPAGLQGAADRPRPAGHPVRALRRRLHPRAHRLRPDDGRRSRPLPPLLGGAGGSGRRARRLALRGARRRAGAGGAAAQDVRRGDGRPLRTRQGRLGPGRPPQPRHAGPPRPARHRPPLLRPAARAGRRRVRLPGRRG